LAFPKIDQLANGPSLRTIYPRWKHPDPDQVSAFHQGFSAKHPQ